MIGGLLRGRQATGQLVTESACASAAPPVLVTTLTVRMVSPGFGVVVSRRIEKAPVVASTVVVFRRDGGLLLKRAVALGADEVSIEDGVLLVNGVPVDEPYVDLSRVDGNYFGPRVVPAGSVFVLGDNRADSVDSRDFGPVPLTALVGRVRLRLWPPALL